MQLATTKVNPVRPYNRFGPSKVADTGIDPFGSYKHFVENDPITNIDIHRDHLKTVIKKESVKIPRGQVPYGTTV